MKIYIACGIVVLSMLIGCGPKKPDGLPKLYPCTIKLTQEGKPASGFSVQLVSKGAPMPWMIGGQSDINGMVKPMTHGQYLGVPEGTFSVVLDKTETEGVDHRAEVQTKPIKVYSLIAEEYKTADKSPLTLTVDKKKIEQTFDLGPSIKKLTETIQPGR